jgi:hypothetical protein
MPPGLKGEKRTGAVEKRVGQDGKTRRLPKPPPPEEPENFRRRPRTSSLPVTTSENASYTSPVIDARRAGGKLLVPALDNALCLGARGSVGNLPLRGDGNVEASCPHGHRRSIRGIEPSIQPMRAGFNSGSRGPSCIGRRRRP